MSSDFSRVPKKPSSPSVFASLRDTGYLYLTNLDEIRRCKEHKRIFETFVTVLAILSRRGSSPYIEDYFYDAVEDTLKGKNPKYTKFLKVLDDYSKKDTFVLEETMSSIPPELIAQIAENLSIYDINNLMKTNSEIYVILKPFIDKVKKQVDKAVKSTDDLRSLIKAKNNVLASIVINSQLDIVRELLPPVNRIVSAMNEDDQHLLRTATISLAKGFYEAIASDNFELFKKIAQPMIFKAYLFRDFENVGYYIKYDRPEFFEYFVENTIDPDELSQIIRQFILYNEYSFRTQGVYSPKLLALSDIVINRINELDPDEPVTEQEINSYKTLYANMDINVMQNLIKDIETQENRYYNEAYN